MHSAQRGLNNKQPEDIPYQITEEIEVNSQIQQQNIQSYIISKQHYFLHYKLLKSPGIWMRNWGLNILFQKLLRNILLKLLALQHGPDFN